MIRTLLAASHRADKGRSRRLVSTVLCVVMATQAAGAQCERPTTLPGANVAGGEFNAGKLPAVYARDYIYPAAGEVALMKALGLKLMRVPFLWERLQPIALGPLDVEESARIDEVINRARAAGLTVVLDVHNYGNFNGISLGDKALPGQTLANLWQRLALRYGGDLNVVFGLMNEPKDIDVDTWAEIAAATLSSIRATGSQNVVLVPGTHWDGAHSWFDGPQGHSNADALLPLARNDRQIVFEVHQYFDDNFSGTSSTCGAAGRVPAILAAVSTWAETNQVRVMLGEFGVSQMSECVKALDDALAVIEEHRDAWYGWTYWAAGAWWGSYPFNLQSSNGDNAQARVVRARAAALDASICAK